MRPLIRWIPRWQLSTWTVFVEEWESYFLGNGNGDAMARTTGRYFEASPTLWIWISFLRWLLGSRLERVRVWAAARWRNIEVTYFYPTDGEVPDFRGRPVIGGYEPRRSGRFS